MTLPPAFLYNSLASHILLAACAQGEVAAEVQVAHKKKAIHGAFTIALIERLSELDFLTSKITYQKLFMNFSLGKSQHPQCVGMHLNRALFSRRIVETVVGFKVTEQESGEYVVEAGAIHGVRQGTKFAISIQDDHSSGTTYSLTAKTVSTISCVCCSIVPLPKATATAVIDDNLLQDSYEEQTSAVDSKVILTPKYDIASQPCLGTSDYFLVTRLDPLMKRFSRLPIRINPQYHAKSIAHFNYHLYRQSLHRGLSGVDVSLHRLVKMDGGWYDVENDHPMDVFDTTEMVVDFKSYGITRVRTATLSGSDLLHYYGIKLVNKCARDLYPYLFYFDPNNYSITVSLSS